MPSAFSKPTSNYNLESNLANRTIAVIGLGYFGLPLAVELGKNRPVIGFDIKAGRIAAFQAEHEHTPKLSQENLCEAQLLTFFEVQSFSLINKIIKRE